MKKKSNKQKLFQNKKTKEGIQKKKDAKRIKKEIAEDKKIKESIIMSFQEKMFKRQVEQQEKAEKIKIKKQVNSYRTLSFFNKFLKDDKIKSDIDKLEIEINSKDDNSKII